MPGATVECYAGARYPERPYAFCWQGERLAVEQVEQEWRTPDGLVFCVRAMEGRRFTLIYRAATSGVGTDCWHIEPCA